MQSRFGDRKIEESILDSDRELKDKVNKASLPVVIVQTLEEVFKSMSKSKYIRWTWDFNDLNRLEHFTGDELITAIDDDIKRFCTSLYNKLKGLKVKVRYKEPVRLSKFTNGTAWNITIIYKSTRYTLYIDLLRRIDNNSIIELQLGVTDDEIAALLPKG